MSSPYGVILPSAELIPELPDARIVLIDEGGYKPDGYWTVAYRVHQPQKCSSPIFCPCRSVAQKISWEKGVFQELLVCTPTEAQHILEGEVQHSGEASE